MCETLPVEREVETKSRRVLVLMRKYFLKKVWLQPTRNIWNWAEQSRTEERKRSHVMRISRVLIENHINFKAVGDAWNIGTD